MEFLFISLRSCEKQEMPFPNLLAEREKIFALITESC